MEKEILIWTAISAIAACVSSIGALAAIFFTFKTIRDQIKTSRPFFNIKEPGLLSTPNQVNTFRMKIIYENCGLWTAYEVVLSIKMIETGFQQDPLLNVIFPLANDVPAHTPTPYYQDDLHLPINCPVHYIYSKISYKDRMLNKEYSQEYFMKWNGVQNGITDPNFVHTTQEEKTNILRYIENHA